MAMDEQNKNITLLASARTTWFGWFLSTVTLSSVIFGYIVNTFLQKENLKCPYLFLGAAIIFIMAILFGVWKAKVIIEFQINELHALINKAAGAELNEREKELLNKNKKPDNSSDYLLFIFVVGVFLLLISIIFEVNFPFNTSVNFFDKLQNSCCHIGKFLPKPTPSKIEPLIESKKIPETQNRTPLQLSIDRPSAL
ncbi:MAG: hypothetical protein HQM15_07300 [Deltaproteobacteria bacterium]|nr:hypothetical protein [Deltaproteobacteria bacterium]